MANNRINSRSKGNKNERELAKLFKDWTGKEFARTPSSGGLQWKSSNSKGDIVCTTEGHYFPFCIEAKNHKEINFAELLMPDKKGVKILEFWEQCERDAVKAKKIPILFMRYNGMPKNFHFVVLKLRHFEKLTGTHDIKENFKYTQTSRHKKLKLTTLTSTEFFNLLDYKETRLKAKALIKTIYGKN